MFLLEEEVEASRSPIVANGESPRRVILLTTRQDDHEARRLIQAVGFELVDTVRQLRTRDDPATYLGSGKVAEVRELIQDLPPPMVSDAGHLVVLDGESRPSVVFNLQEGLGVEVWDRVRLILEIFERHAHVREARLQVELAKLRYELPFVHEAIHRRLTGERAGFMGGGEMEIRTYERHLKRRVRQIRLDLETVRKERSIRRAGRRRTGFRLVALAGYTNSGKSSLLNALTKSEVHVKDQFFSTLQTATRRLHSMWAHKGPTDLVFTDTVGFIRELPPWLIDAFTSTLEEITYADAVVLVVDAKLPMEELRSRLSAAFEILERIRAPQRRVVVLNKIDLVEPPRRFPLQEQVQAFSYGAIVTTASVRTGTGLQELVRILMDDILENRLVQVTLDLGKPEHARLEHWIREHAQVLGQDDEDTHRRLSLRCPATTWGRLLHEVHVARARLTQEQTSIGN